MTNDEETRWRKIEAMRDYRVFAAEIRQHTNADKEASEHAAILATTALNAVWDGTPPIDQAEITVTAIKIERERAGLRRAALDLHQGVQWSGWRLWMQRAGRNPLAFYESWCCECRKPWPCPTRKAAEE